MPLIKQAASELESRRGERLSEHPDGGLIVILEKRETLDPAEFEKSRPLSRGPGAGEQATRLFSTNGCASGAGPRGFRKRAQTAAGAPGLTIIVGPAGRSMESVDEIFDDANGDLAIGELESAVEKYRRCVELDPQFFDGWHALGMALMKLGRFPEAIEAGKKTVGAQA